MCWIAVLNAGLSLKATIVSKPLGHDPLSEMDCHLAYGVPFTNMINFDPSMSK